LVGTKQSNNTKIASPYRVRNDVTQKIVMHSRSEIVWISIIFFVILSRTLLVKGFEIVKHCDYEKMLFLSFQYFRSNQPSGSNSTYAPAMPHDGAGA
jgi:hypothetical protein